MRFRYAFQKIVDLKTNEKTQAEWMLSEAIGRVREEESSLTELHTEKDDLHDQLHTVSSNKATISQILMLQQFVDHIDQKIVTKNKDLQQAQQVMLTKQEVLNGKMLEEKIWCKAKDRAQQRFTATALKKEQEQLDEMATTRFRRLS
ncbi:MULTISPECIES: flagellar export protein FliJ [Paenibacillus]|uniref:Flagellar FliJ protein n=1 Tax=Paenibacillus radicis (ex Xue et al. 2023) TaxID=2972489 RepID=A0ABT1YCA3_9BACL|nr:flagellar export protein FliJ [Paenibacillus radicis (ex Xue et al. 2023)]MCR8630812.1 flagellar export protein FliJ [Paenibacillus radicis (ex Xue et al. 2023)]